MRRGVVEAAGRLAQRAAGREGALELLDPAEGGADRQGDALGRRVEGCSREEVVGRGEEQLRGPAARARRPPRAELLDLAAPAHAETVHGEALDPRDAVAARHESRPEGVEIASDRGDGPRGHDDDGLSAQAPRSRRRRS